MKQKELTIHIAEDAYRTIIVCENGTILYGGKVKSTSDNGHGYKSVSFCIKLKNGRQFHKRKYVHRLVAEAFLGDPTGLDVNHLDFNRSNNALSNLSLATRTENLRYSVLRGRSRLTGEYADYLLVMGLHFHLGLGISKIRDITKMPRDWIREAVNGAKMEFKKKYIESGNLFNIKEFKVSYWDLEVNKKHIDKNEDSKLL